jgi:hypothetical protein
MFSDPSDAAGEKSVSFSLDGKSKTERGARSRLYRQRIKAGVAFG